MDHKQQPYVTQQPVHPQQPHQAYQGQQGYHHQPIQPDHPPMGEKHAHAHAYQGHGPSWTSGLFSCFSPLGTCCLSTWCPCIQFGKTYAREHGDPNSSGLNGMCCAYYMLSCIGGHCILQCVDRGHMREKYGIEGSSFGDCCGACWCGCCQLVQHDKESKLRSHSVDPKTKSQYQPVQGMQYP